MKYVVLNLGKDCKTVVPMVYDPDKPIGKIECQFEMPDELIGTKEGSDIQSNYCRPICEKYQIPGGEFSRICLRRVKK